MHPEALAGARAALAHVTLPPSPHCLDLGGQDVNGTAHHLVPDATWDVLDIEDGPGVTVVADATTWIPTRQYDLVLSTEMLEHVENWRGVLTTARHALADHGALVLTCASTGRRPHGATGAAAPAGGEWYGNVEPADLIRELASRFRAYAVTYQSDPGDLYAWARDPW